MKTSRSSLLILTLLLTFSVTGCGPGKPTSDEVLNHLKASLNVSAPYELTDIQQPDFLPQGDGTVTVKGGLTGKLKSDLYERADYEARIKELGYDDLAWKNAVRDAQTLREPYRSTLMSQIPSDFQNHQELTLIKIATPSGSDVHFNFETTATKGQAGWTFSDDQIVPVDMPQGAAKDTFGSDALVVGSDEEKSQDQAYVGKIQTFIKAVDDSKKAIAAEDEKARQALISATASGKTYVGTSATNNASWPLGLCITEQQQIGAGVTLKGYLFDPVTPTHKIDIVGNIEFDSAKAQGRPIQFTVVHGSGMNKSIARAGNGTDLQLGGDPYGDDLTIQLALDGQGNLIGSDGRMPQINLAPKP